jgi:hypothetical protein
MVPATGGTDDSGRVVVDVPGVQRASARLVDAAQAYDQLAARIRNRPLPEMPPGLAAYVTAELADISRLLGGQTEPLVATAQELRVRAFWAEIADKLEGGNDLQGAQLTEFKAAYASGLLTEYADPGLAELADAYAKKVHDQEHPGGFVHGVGEFFSGAWEAIKEPTVMLYHLSPLDSDSEKYWRQLEQGVAFGVEHPAEFGKTLVNLDALHKRGVAYWIGTLAPAAIGMVAGGVAVVTAARAGAAAAKVAEAGAALDTANTLDAGGNTAGRVEEGLRAAEQTPATAKAGATVGRAANTNYRATFFSAHPDLEGQVVVHHAVEQQVLKRYSGLFEPSEVHSLENLRGIPIVDNAATHLSAIRRSWNRFYKANPTATREEVLAHATEIDQQFGSGFLPGR